MTLRECDAMLEKIIRKTRDSYTLEDMELLAEGGHKAILQDGHVSGWEEELE